MVSLFEQVKEPGMIELEAVLAENPDIGRKFVEMAFQAKRSGRTRYGAKALVEIMRFETAIRQGVEFKLNNNLTAYLARWAMDKHPELAGFFETREVKKDDAA